MRFKNFAFVFILFIIPAVLVAQKSLDGKYQKPIICYGSPVNRNTILNPPKEYLKWKDSPNARTKSAAFVVTYIGFTSEAKASFQKAVDIWSTLISSSQVIRVTARWQKLDAGVLGSALWGSIHANFPGAQQMDTYYPVALAEKIAGQELNSTTDADIVANFSSNANWSYSLNGTPAAGKYDLVTVVLHELGHGLGFVDSYSVNGTQGSVGLDDGIPMIYDLSIETNAGNSIFKNFTSPSTGMKTQLTNDNVFYNSPLATAANGGVRARVYAPTTFDGGSSISHWDEFIFPSGNANSLMTPQIGMAEVMQNPGPIMLAAFSDMGWISTTIKHDKLQNVESTSGPFVVKASITTDATPVSNILLHYNINGAETQVAMTPTGISNEYAANIPGTNTPTTYGYYISVNDNIRSYTSPGKLINANKVTEQTYFSFTTGPDTQAPVITHTAKESIFNTDTDLKIEATVTDNLGIDLVTVEYTINGVNQPSKTLTQGASNKDAYSISIIFPVAGIHVGDVVNYRITARDKAVIGNATGNKAYSPSATEFHSLTVVGFKTVQNTYANNFNTPSTDFYGEGFSITTPVGFANAALNSQHPYQEGHGFLNDERNSTYQLLVPIRIAAQNAIITFDEIALTEPGEVGSVFGDNNFYDYVIVEGSTNKGTTWKATQDGYNSRSNKDWLTRYNSSFSGNNSTAKGDPSLYRARVINLLNTFNVGDEVIFRFRLYSDPFSAGWGWAIDNLLIQDPVTLVDEVGHDFMLRVYPNPATDKVTLEVPFTNSEAFTVTVLDTKGRSIFKQEFTNERGLKHQVDINALHSGLYILTVQAGQKKYARKFIKAQ